MQAHPGILCNVSPESSMIGWKERGSELSGSMWAGGEAFQFNGAYPSTGIPVHRPGKTRKTERAQEFPGPSVVSSESVRTGTYGPSNDDLRIKHDQDRVSSGSSFPRTEDPFPEESAWKARGYHRSFHRFRTRTERLRLQNRCWNRWPTPS